MLFQSFCKGTQKTPVPAKGRVIYTRGSTLIQLIHPIRRHSPHWHDDNGHDPADPYSRIISSKGDVLNPLSKLQLQRGKPYVITGGNFSQGSSLCTDLACGRCLCQRFWFNGSHEKIMDQQLL